MDFVLCWSETCSSSAPSRLQHRRLAALTMKRPRRGISGLPRAGRKDINSSATATGLCVFSARGHKWTRRGILPCRHNRQRPSIHRRRRRLSLLLLPPSRTGRRLPQPTTESALFLYAWSGRAESSPDSHCPSPNLRSSSLAKCSRSSSIDLTCLSPHSLSPHSLS